jgi:hypothetical protein
MRILEHDRPHASLRCVYHHKIGKGDPVADDRSSSEIVDNAMSRGLTPVKTSIRGGTDGSRLSYTGHALSNMSPLSELPKAARLPKSSRGYSQINQERQRQA